MLNPLMISKMCFDKIKDGCQDGCCPQMPQYHKNQNNHHKILHNNFDYIQQAELIYNIYL